ncbi:hypothetical protein GIB67_009922 [Kingdonia uniflora]|uniref:Uncharacterized protein n=1 Tax=Kingdonia uniflora TaxID=39325 RepID=A0A7J7L496_9MAGN|nr:hypothetical protein GIB67_009922 [Kingdonia uniflora]
MASKTLNLSPPSDSDTDSDNTTTSIVEAIVRIVLGVMDMEVIGDVTSSDTELLQLVKGSSNSTMFTPPRGFSAKLGLFDPIRGFASDSLAVKPDFGICFDLPTTVAAVKNPSSKIVYDEHRLQ